MFIKHAIKPLILLLLYTSIITIYFWTSSRYPDLSAKAVLGEHAAMSNLGFTPIINIDDSFSFWQKVFAETINWINTNKKGMSFSFLIGASFLTFMPLLRKRRFKYGFTNSLFGMAVGAPLGICVNCAAPIARSLHAAGSSLQTSLAALISSPTLNVVVITMAFSMLPFYLVAMKLAFTFLFILVIIPLACRYLFYKEAYAQENSKFCEIENVIDSKLNEKQNTWKGAGLWFIKTYFKNFFFLLKIALPLMFLAGFLGSLLTFIMPWSGLQSINNDLEPKIMIGVLVGLSIFGAFLPSPIAFDVIISSVLLQSGVPVQYVAVFLFTLGSFSIYAFFIIWRSISLRLATFLFATTSILGIAAGLLSIQFEQNTLSKAHEEVIQINEYLEEKAKTEEIANTKKEPQESQNFANKDNKFDPIIEREDKALSYEEIKNIIDKNKVIPRPFPKEYIKEKPNNITIEWRENYKQSLNSNDQPFTYIQGEDLNIKQPYSVAYITGSIDLIPLATMSVAVADVHNDGWADILLMGDHEYKPNIILYANNGGNKFIRQKLPVPDHIKEVILVALVDLNADGWKDIIFTTYKDGDFIIYNEKGEFKKKNFKAMPHYDGTTMSMSFADIDKDGDLDIFLGKWNVGPNYLNFSRSKNIILRKEDYNSYSPEYIDGLSGETLTSLFTDINEDGNIDLFIGNDYLGGEYSDLILLGDKNGKFTIPDETITKNILGAQTTMSIDSGDIDNDLKPDYYIGQIAYTGQWVSSMSKIADKQISYLDYCKLAKQNKKTECEEEMELRLAMARVSHHISDACDNIKNKVNKAKCLRHLVGLKKCFMNSQANRLYIPIKHKVDISERAMRICKDKKSAAIQKDENGNIEYDSSSGHLKAANQSLNNILLHNKGIRGNILFSDEANIRNVGYGAWTWNARFADFDNDEWQDIYIVNGYSMPMALSTNIFYKNMGGGKFKETTEEFGLENYSQTSAFSLADFDNDGDLDIVNISTDDPVQFYINNTNKNSLIIALKDKTGKNPDAIGAKITIYYKDKHQMRIIKGSGGYHSYNQPIAHFGLGDNEQINHMEITWPDGIIDKIKGSFKSGSKYVITRQ